MEPGLQITGTAPDHRTGSYRAWRLQHQGSSMVDLAWYSRVDHGRPEAHRLLPHSEPSLAIRRRFDRDGATTDYRVEITCIRPDGGQYCPEPGEELFALRLAPELIETGLGLRAAEMHGEDRVAPRLLIREMAEVERFAERDDFHSAWNAMLVGLRRLGSEAAPDRLGHAAAISRRISGRITPGELAEQAGISPRHLRRGFVERFGLSPRAWARRLRLTAAMLEAEAQDRPDWAGIAVGNRFSDQAHLIRECRSILGESPREFHALRRTMAVSFNP